MKSVQEITLSDIAFIELILPIGEQYSDKLADLPLRNGQSWAIKIDIQHGNGNVIQNWHIGHSMHIMLKVCDEGVYSLLNKDGNVLFEKQACYVPHFIPNKYNDYVVFDIDENGVILNMPQPCLDEFSLNEFLDDIEADYEVIKALLEKETK